MDLICYLHETWRPWIRPADSSRPWMDETPHSFAYRCLPLSIANSNGWELLSPCDFEVSWNGNKDLSDISIDVDSSVPEELRPQSMFGNGTFTFHVMGLFKTDPGWNLWIGGSPNRPKDGVSPLTGIIETDWSPYTFTMNWIFTRRNRSVKFEKGEPIGFFFPIQRDTVEKTRPVYVPFQENPRLLDQFTQWSKSRDELRERMVREPAKNPSDQWQKYYYRGLDMDGKPGIADHHSKVRPNNLIESVESPLVDLSKPAAGVCPYHVRLENTEPEQAKTKEHDYKSLKRAQGFTYRSDPYGRFQLNSTAEELGKTLGLIAQAMQNGSDKQVLIEQLVKLGLSSEKAGAVLAQAFSGSPRLF